MGKWAKPDLSDLDNDLLNNSMKSVLLTVDQYHPQEAVYKKLRKKVILLRELAKSNKQPNLTFLGPFRP